MNRALYPNEIPGDEYYPILAPNQLEVRTLDGLSKALREHTEALQNPMRQYGYEIGLIVRTLETRTPYYSGASGRPVRTCPIGTEVVIASFGGPLDFVADFYCPEDGTIQRVCLNRTAVQVVRTFQTKTPTLLIF